MLQAPQTLDGHVYDDTNQQQRTGVASQNFNFPGPEGKAIVAAQAARQYVGGDRESQRNYMRAHVPAVGQ